MDDPAVINAPAPPPPPLRATKTRRRANSFAAGRRPVATAVDAQDKFCFQCHMPILDGRDWLRCSQCDAFAHFHCAWASPHKGFTGRRNVYCPNHHILGDQHVERKRAHYTGWQYVWFLSMITGFLYMGYCSLMRQDETPLALIILVVLFFTQFLVE